MYRPALSVVAFCETCVPSLVIVTVAPGTTPPLESVTVPRTSAEFVPCPTSEVGYWNPIETINTTARKRGRTKSLRISFPLQQNPGEENSAAGGLPLLYEGESGGVHSDLPA